MVNRHVYKDKSTIHSLLKQKIWGGIASSQGLSYDTLDLFLFIYFFLSIKTNIIKKDCMLCIKHAHTAAMQYSKLEHIRLTQDIKETLNTRRCCKTPRPGPLKQRTHARLNKLISWHTRSSSTASNRPIIISF